MIFGRHPGHGAPGGAAVEPDVFEAVLGGVEAQGDFARLDAVITGHFSSAGQVAIAAAAVARIKAASPAARVVVDPIMGDAGRGLYVPGPVAEALAAELVPEAHVLAPNAWELARLSGLPVSDPASAVTAARAMGRAVLVSSVMAAGADWRGLRDGGRSLVRQPCAERVGAEGHGRSADRGFHRRVGSGPRAR